MKAPRPLLVESNEIVDRSLDSRGIVIGSSGAARASWRGISYREVLVHNKAGCLGFGDIFKNASLGGGELLCRDACDVGGF
jgi:hypothetical protein